MQDWASTIDSGVDALNPKPFNLMLFGHYG